MITNFEVGKSTATIPLDLTTGKAAPSQSPQTQSPQSPKSFNSPVPAVSTVAKPATGATALPAASKAPAVTRAAPVLPTTRAGSPVAGSAKGPKSGEEVCALVTREEASGILGVAIDKAVPGSSTGFSCDYYGGENLLFQVFFEKVKVPRNYLDSTKVVYPDARQIPGVGENNWWSAESSRYEIFQGESYFAIPVLTGETNKEKLLGQATNIAKLVISRLK